MKKILFAVLASVLFAVSANAQTATLPSGKVQSVQVPDGAITATLNAVCPSPTTGCATGQAIVIPVVGRKAVTILLTDAAFNASVTPYLSMNGSVWVATQMRTNGNGLTSISNTAAVTAINDSTSNHLWIPVGLGGITHVMLAVTTYTSGTSSALAVASDSEPQMLAYTVSPKGSQPINSIGVATQNLKDAGRSYVVFSADGVTPAIAETVITFTKTVADTQTAAQTTYTITNGKTLRIQSVCASATMGAAANRVRVALRLNTGGACIAGSNILLPVIELAPNYGTATAAEGGASGCVSIPDGLEIAGNGTKAICLSESATAASGTLTTNLIGFEY